MSSKKKTILFVMPRFPFPATSGRKTSLYHYCRIISQKLGYRLVVAAFAEKGDNPDLLPDFIDRFEILPQASSQKKMLNVFLHSVVRQQKPMQVSLYWSEDAKRIVDSIVEDEQPCAVIADMVRCVDYIRDIDAFRIADLDDRISLRYRRQLDNDISGINPYGSFINNVPNFLRKIMLFRPIKLFVVKNEIRLLKQYELEVGKTCECTVFVAESEAKNFNCDLGEERAVAIPIGVDVDYFSYRNTGLNENIVGFLGALGVAHNENAVRHFISYILPKVLHKIPDTIFMVIGGGASDDLRKLASENVVFTGQVDDVREYLEKCKVFTCPMTFGSGIKTKNLEAMALGVPVVTSLIGAENINAINNQDWIVADNDASFAESIIELLLS